MWPPLSPISNADVGAPGELSPGDWTRITFLEQPWCDACGTPFPYAIGRGGVCAPCAARALPLTCVRSAFVYDAQSRALVFQLKHGGRTDGLKAFARWMARAGHDCLCPSAVLVPVPLHPKRLRQRRFNQSLLLARALSRETGLEVAAHWLERVRATPSQGGLSAKGRARNVAGAFKLRTKLPAALKDLNLVLVDDVYTTGATLSACARALKRAGAANVSAITLARVVKPVDPLK